MAPPTLILGGYSIGKVRFVNEVEVLDPRSIGNPVLADGYTDTLGIMCDYYLGSECIHMSLAFFLGARGENNEVEGLGDAAAVQTNGLSSAEEVGNPTLKNRWQA